MFIAAMTLAACGGGDGFPGYRDPSTTATVTALYTTAPTGGVTIATAGSGVYTVGGGTAGYSANTSNAAVATAALVDSTLTITGVSGGSATVEVRDAAGATVSVTVTVTPASTAELFTTAPNAVTVTVGAAQSYSIRGGTAPYTVVSSNTAVSPATLVGASTLNVPGTTAGSAQVVVFDSANQSVTIGVTVASAGSATPLYVMAPDGGVTIGAPGTGIYTVGGGAPGYKAISSNPAVATVNVVGTTLTITGISGGAVSVAIYDAALGKLSLAVTVVAAKPLATTAPGLLVLDLTGAGAVSPVYQITGGTAPYYVNSGNANIVQVGLGAGMGGGGQVGVAGEFFLTGKTAGTTQVTILDSSNNQLIITVTVAGPAIALYATTPAAVTIATGPAPNYAIGGGTAPYTVTSSNVLVATASVTGGTTLNITGIAAGAANVVVTDAVGATLTIAVTVSSTTTTPVVATPSSATGSIGDVLNFSVSGGSPAYALTVNNPSIASVSATTVATSGGHFTATLLNVGSTSIAIVDAQGQTTTLTLTAAAPSALLRLSPSTLAVGEDYLGLIPLSIYGGTGPYSAYTSDLVLTGVSVSGSTLTIGLGTQTTRCINPGTAYGTYPITITVVDKLGASATSVLTIQDNGKVSTGC